MKVMKKQLICHRNQIPYIMRTSLILGDWTTMVGVSTTERRGCYVKCVFTLGNSPTGCTNFRTSSLTRHTDSTEHRNALLASNMQTDLKRAMARALSHQEEDITTAQKTAYWLAKENVAMRKFGSLMKLPTSGWCPNVDKLDCGENVKYMSNQAAEEFQDACAVIIAKEIERQIQKSRSISVLVDESTDSSVTQKLILRLFYDWRFCSVNNSVCK